MITKPLNIFFEEPDPDRWIKYDHYPRKLLRRLIRGKPKPGGVMIAALNLIKGFDILKIPYRYNDFHHIKKHPEEIACILGKPHLIFERKWQNPIIFGPGTFSHPVERPDLFKEYPNIKRIIVFGEWMRQMFFPFYGNKVVASPVGIDTEYWQIPSKTEQFDFLIYDKVRWDYEKEQKELIEPIKKILQNNDLSFQTIKYGQYNHEELLTKIKNSKSVIFLCEHETQGIAYQQILSTNTPILAWDRGGYWQDPTFYPNVIKYQPVSSVPYWDERCGVKFSDATVFEKQLAIFLANWDLFEPRTYITDNLTLEKCATTYLQIYDQILKELL